MAHATIMPMPRAGLATVKGLCEASLCSVCETLLAHAPLRSRHASSLTLPAGRGCAWWPPMHERFQQLPLCACRAYATRTWRMRQCVNAMLPHVHGARHSARWNLRSSEPPLRPTGIVLSRSMAEILHRFGHGPIPPLPPCVILPLYGVRPQCPMEASVGAGFSELEPGT